MRSRPLALLLLLTLAGSAAAGGMTQGDAGRSGASDGQLPTPLHAWVFERAKGPPVAGDGVVYTLADPVGTDPSIHAQARGIHVAAVRTSDGTPAWEAVLHSATAMAAAFQQGRYVAVTPPTLAAGLLLLQDSEGDVWALHASNGTLAWKMSLGGASPVPTDASPLVLGTSLYLLASPVGGGEGPSLLAFDLLSRSVAWSTPAAWRSQELPVQLSALSSDGQRILFRRPPTATDGPAVVAFSTTGSRLWDHPLAPGADWSLPVAAGGRVLVAGRSADAPYFSGNWTLHVKSLDAATGALQWARDDREPSPPCCFVAPEVAPVAVRGGDVAAVGTHRLLLLSAATGQVRWNATLRELVGGPASFVGDAVVVGQWAHNHAAVPVFDQVQVRDAQTGALRWAAGTTSDFAFGRGATAAFGLDGLLVGNFHASLVTDAPAYLSGLLAFGPDTTAPRWAPGPTLRFTQDAPGASLLRGEILDLNPAGARVEQADDPAGPWSTAAWLPSIPFRPGEDRAWTPPPPTAQPRYYRMVPVDKAGLEGPPSAVLKHVVPPPYQPPPAPMVVTVDGPAPNATVSGTVGLHGRTFWRSNGTPIPGWVQVAIDPPVRPDGGRPPPFFARVASDGAWSAQWDSTTISQDPSRPLWPDGPAQVRVGFEAGGNDVTFMVRTANGHHATIESASVVASRDKVVEGEPVDIAVNLTVLSGVRPDALRVSYEWPMPSKDGHQVGAGVGAPASFTVLEEGPNGLRLRVTSQVSLYTVGWPENATVKVGLRLERAGQALAVPASSFPIRVQPDGNATQRAAAIQESRRASNPVPVPEAIAVGAGAVGLVGVAALVGTEAGRYAVLRGLGGLALFTRLRGNQVLEHRRRERLYLLVEGRPGMSFGDLGEAAGMREGVLAHHLATLEREGLVRRQRLGTRLAFYAAQSPTAARQVPALQARLLALVRRGPVSQAEAARQLGVTRQALHYHVKALHALGLLEVAREGRETPLALARGAASRLWPCPTCRSLLLGDRTVATLCPACGASAPPAAAASG